MLSRIVTQLKRLVPNSEANSNYNLLLDSETSSDDEQSVELTSVVVEPSSEPTQLKNEDENSDALLPIELITRISEFLDLESVANLAATSKNVHDTIIKYNKNIYLKIPLQKNENADEKELEHLSLSYAQILATIKNYKSLCAPTQEKIKDINAEINKINEEIRIARSNTSKRFEYMWSHHKSLTVGGMTTTSLATLILMLNILSITLTKKTETSTSFQTMGTIAVLLLAIVSGAILNATQPYAETHHLMQEKRSLIDREKDVTLAYKGWFRLLDKKIAPHKLPEEHETSIRKSLLNG